MTAAAITVWTLFVDGVLAGVFLGSSLVEHAARTLDAPCWIAYKQAKERVFGGLMPVLFGLGLVSTLVTAALSGGRLLFWVAAVLLAAVLAITVRVHLPLNRLIQTWSATAVPPAWDRARRRWRDWNWLRCVLAMAAFALVLAGRR